MSEARIGVIGGGNMARAIIEGGLASGRFGPGTWVVAEPDGAKRERLAALGVGVVEHAGALGDRLAADAQILLAVKPQMLGEAAADLGGVARGRVVVSILAGTPSGKVRDALGGEAGGCRVIRVMPNTPARIRRGTSALAVGAGASEEDASVAEAVFGAVGSVVRVEEGMIDAFTAMAGSGPAYLFYFAEAMVEAGREVGFSPADAESIARSTLAGAGLLLEGAEESAADLRRAVTSKGGTTEAALSVLDRDGVGQSIVRAIVAARDRGVELAG